jgi:hypothetical protein
VDVSKRLGDIKGNPLIREIGRRVKTGAALLRWNLRSFSRLAGPGGLSGERRLLMVYDFSTQPFSIGDILVIQEASLVLRLAMGLDRVDFALVYNPASPVVPDPTLAHYDPESFLWHLPNVLQAAQVNPHLGSVFLYDSHRRLEEFAAGHLHLYEIWPPLSQYAYGEYLYYRVFNEVLFEHYERERTLPRLESRGPARAWATGFLQRHVGSDIPVTVQLRKNPYNAARDMDNDSWQAFFQFCQGRYPAKFLVICARDEVDARFRRCPNVVIAKDHCTSVEQDLALVDAAAIHMGATSGPGVMAIFSAKPYCLFKSDLRVDRYKGITQDGSRHALFFAAPAQSFLFGPETPDLIAGEFARMWEVIEGSSRR